MLKLSFIPRPEVKALQNLEVKMGPRSDTISSGIPCSRKMNRNILARCSEVNPSSLKGRKCAIFVRRHTITIIESQSPDGGSLTMASIDMDFQGPVGIGNGLRSPTGRWRGDLFRWQV